LTDREEFLRRRKILIVTGELSGSLYGKEIARELSPNFEVYGVFTEEFPEAIRILTQRSLPPSGCLKHSQTFRTS
jgi:lipid-A-disaccharide synthase